MPAVVSDTSAINYLAAIGQVELLRFEFGKIYIPPAGWRVIQQPQPSTILNQLFADLDPGEAEAIALADELKPAIVLSDETDGRAEARRLDLPTIGTIGILASTRKSARVPKIKTTD